MLYCRVDKNISSKSEEKMKIKAGDIVKMSRKNKDYYHYGVFIGNDEVIHLAEDSKTKSQVVKTTMKEFRKKNGSVELVVFPEIKNGKTTFVDVKALWKTEKLVFDKSWSGWFTSLFEEYGIHTRKETMHRAKSKIGRLQTSVFSNRRHGFFQEYMDASPEELHGGFKMFLRGYDNTYCVHLIEQLMVIGKEICAEFLRNRFRGGFTYVNDANQLDVA